MGLDTTHDAFHGAYSAFNSLRQEVCHAIGGSYPPHFLRNYDGDLAKDANGSVIYDRSLDEQRFYLPDDFTEEDNPGVWEFLKHSDCDGDIAPELCSVMADELDKIVPKMREDGVGHIAARGGFRAVLVKFVAGLRAAAAEGVPLGFH
jgi:hypothetical protein